MLQWMGGSRRKVTSSRKSIHNRQKQYFEQRKRQQQVPGLENLSDAHKQAHYHEEPRSLDILSLTNLATVAQQGYSSKNNELDVPQKGYHVSHLSPENVLKKVTSRFPEELKKSCSKPGHLTPTKIAADNGLQNVPSFHGSSSKIDKRNVQSSYCEFTSNNIKKTSKQEEEAQNEVSVFDLLGDDGSSSISYGGQVPEDHVAFSVEGLGKVGFGTPAHSPIRYDRNLPSPPRAPRRIRSSAKHEFSQHRFGIKTNALMQDIREEQDDGPLESLCDRGGIFDDEFSNEKNPLFMFSCASPDAYENQNQKFNYAEEGFYRGGQANQPWNALSPQYFRDLTSEKECNPVSFDQDRHHSCDEMSSPYSLFRPPDWSFLVIEDSQDNMSFLSEESCSSAAVMDERSFDLGSHSTKLKKSKKKHTNQNQKNSRKKYDLGEFPADQIDHSGLEEFLHEWNIAKSENHENMTSPWHSKAGHFSNNHPTFQDTRSLSHKLLSEDDLFDSFPSPELYPSTKSTRGESILNNPKINEPSTNFIYQNEILKQFSVHDVPSPAAFPWETEDNFLYSPFARDFDAQFPGLSKKKNICEDSEDGNRKNPEKAQKLDSIEKNSLSSNGRSAGVADSKKKCSENAELKNESPELFDGPSIEINEEVPKAMKVVPSQLENCVDDNLNHFDSHDPVPSQVATKDENSEPENKRDASYQVMLERYVLQLICVQKVLLEASQKDIEKDAG